MDTQELRKKPIFEHFYQICQIPHGSGNEEALSNAIKAWATQKGWEVQQDPWNNLLIKKEASPGYESAPAVALQAHLDMVCQKAETSHHDFEKDPIPWHIDGDILSTGGQTTLGADDGIGVSLAMAVLDDDNLKHPPLEVILTTNEETDFSGADNFNFDLITANRLINLDNTMEDMLVCGSCGGMRLDYQLPLTFQPVPSAYSAWQLDISGLKGGHSGEDIHRGRGSANVFLHRFLLGMKERGIGCYLTEIVGGSVRNAIPRDARASLWIANEDMNKAKEWAAQAEKMFQRELPSVADTLTVTLQETELERVGVEPGEILPSLLLFPEGIEKMNDIMTGLVDSSSTAGELYLNDKDGLLIVAEIRSAQPSVLEYMYQKIKALAAFTGAQYQESCVYPSWEFRPDSTLRELYFQAYDELIGGKPTMLTVHAGIEVSGFSTRREGLDAISVGPHCYDFHSPSEYVSISSTERIYDVLTRTLELAKE